MKATAELKMLPVSVLKPAAYNPRKKLKPGDKEYEKIKNSITEFGFADPLVVNADMTIIGGHQRLTVAMELHRRLFNNVLIKAEAFKTIFDGFTSSISKNNDSKMRVLAVDGSDIQIATNPDDLSSFHPGANGQKPYNLLHLNALFDLKQKIYTDAIIQGRIDWNEHSALQEMVDRSNSRKALVIADRGYESYNNMAHIQEKGWYFLIRIKDGRTGIKEGLVLPKLDEFDKNISLKLTRKQTKETKELFKDKNHYRFIPSTVTFDYLPQKLRKHDPTEFYTLNFRIVRFKVTDELYETVLTNWTYVNTLDKKS